MTQYRRCVPGLACAMLCLLAFAGLARAAETAPDPLLAGQVLRGHFVQERQLAGFAKPLRSEGTFVLIPGSGLIWRGEKPFANTTVITSGGILQLNSGRQAMRLSASRLPGLGQLYQVLGGALSGNIKPLQQTFTVNQSADENGWRVELKPLNPNSQAMSQLKGLILKGGRFVESVEVDRTGGDVDHITFSSHNISKADLSPDEKSLLKAAGK